MLGDGETIVQGDVYVVREGRPRRGSDRLLLIVLIVLNVAAWSLVIWLSTGFKDDLRDMVINEVPVQVRLILDRKSVG